VFAFILFNIFMSCVALNVIAGVFVYDVKHVADVEHQETFVHDQVSRKAYMMKRIQAIFNRMDINFSGAINQDELAYAFEDPEMTSLFASMDLDRMKAARLFDLLDLDNSGMVNLKEFVVGCVKIQQKVGHLEMMKLHSEIDESHAKMDHMFKHIEHIQAHMEDVVHALSPEQFQLNFHNASQSGHLAHHNSGGAMVAHPSENERRGSVSMRRGLMSMRGSVSKGQGSNSEMAARAQGAVLISSPLAKFDKKMAKATSTKERARIEKTEMRAMLLSELWQVRTIIEQTCVKDSWTCRYKGTPLLPKQVDLYNLDYWVVSPRTAPQSMTLQGLKKQQYYKDQVITQISPSRGQTMAEGVVLEDVEGPEVPVHLLKGKFRCSKNKSDAIIYIDGHDCGVPEDILCVGSFSYKETVSSTPTRPGWYCCHWWGEPVYDFVACCVEHAKHQAQGEMNKESYWVCGYANRQHELAMEISSDPEESSFRKAMKLARGLLMVLDNNANSFTRIWCDFELDKTIMVDMGTMGSSSSKMLDISAKLGKKARLLTNKPVPGEKPFDKVCREQKFPLQLLARGLQVQLEHGQASVEQDRLNILRSIGTDGGRLPFDETTLAEHLEIANGRLRGQIALSAWPQALRLGIVEQFPLGKTAVEGGPTTLNLADVLGQDKGRTQLDLNLSGLEVQDSDMKSIAKGLPCNLLSLTLSFENCKLISDNGLAFIAESLCSKPLADSLQSLELDFLSCSLLSDHGVSFLAANLPQRLKSLKVNFSFCRNISQVSVNALAEGVPASLTVLEASFTGTMCDRIFNTPRDLKHTLGHRSKLHRAGTKILDLVSARQEEKSKW